MSRTIWQLSKRNKMHLAAALPVLLAIAALTWHFTAIGNRGFAHRFVVGQRLVYKLEYLSASAADFGVLTQGAARDADPDRDQEILTNVNAELHGTVLEVSANGAVIACIMRNPKVQVVFNGELVDDQADMIQTDLGRMLIADVDRNGRMVAVHLDPNVRALSHTFVRALLAATQVVLPDDPAPSAWETREADTNGEYVAQYQREAADAEQAHVAVFTRERLRYLPRPRQHSIRKLDIETTARPSGNLTIRFDLAAGRIDSIEGTEATTIFVDEKVVARAETTVRLQLASSETLSRSALDKLIRACAALKTEPAIALSAPTPTTGRDTAIHRNELGDATLESLLAELARIEANADENVVQTPVYLKLKALIYLQPETCPRLAKELIAAKADSRTMQILTGALASIGNAQAQSALATAIRARPHDEPALAMLVAALAMVDTPTEASEQALRDLAATSPLPNVRASAELGLGTMAHQLADIQPHRTARIVRAVAAQLDKATSVDARRQYLLVLGNAGANESLDVIARYLGDAEPEVRAAAAAALRWIDATEADRLLCNALAGDADATVRIEAATALGFRAATPASFAVQKNAFLKDTATGVRLAVMPALARAGERDLLTRALTDSAQEVREQAANLLAIE